MVKKWHLVQLLKLNKKGINKMTLNDLKTILKSNRGGFQFAILYDSKANADIDTGSIEYIIEQHGEKEVIRIEAFENQLLITV